MTIKQYVNLPKDEIFKDSDVSSVDRCGSVTIEIEIENTNSCIPYKVKVVPSGNDNVTYNADEQKRNPNFKMEYKDAGVADSKKIKVEDLKLPVAGGNKYKIEVKDSLGNLLSSDKEIEVHRKLYYQTMSMIDTIGNKVSSYSLSSMEKNAKKYFIHLSKKCSEAKIPYIKTLKMHRIGSNLDAFGYAIENNYLIDKKMTPLSVAAVFSDYIASMGSYEMRHTVVIGVHNNEVTWDSNEMTIFIDRFLWYGLDDGDDAFKMWFVDGYISYSDNKPGSTTGYFIDKSKIGVEGPKRCTHGGYHHVKIKIDSGLKSILDKKSGKIDITLEVNIADGWTNGFSWKYGDASLITCASKTVWEDMPQQTKEYTWNHEVGHRFGMVAYGNKTHPSNRDFIEKKYLPDAPATLYGENRGINDNNHSGPHCSKGANFDSSTATWSGNPGCVMFGANGIGNNHAQDDYCSECQVIVRKLDLSL